MKEMLKLKEKVDFLKELKVQELKNFKVFYLILR